MSSGRSFSREPSMCTRPLRKSSASMFAWTSVFICPIAVMFLVSWSSQRASPTLTSQVQWSLPKPSLILFQDLITWSMQKSSSVGKRWFHDRLLEEEAFRGSKSHVHLTLGLGGDVLSEKGNKNAFMEVFIKAPRAFRQAFRCMNLFEDVGSFRSRRFSCVRFEGSLECPRASSQMRRFKRETVIYLCIWKETMTYLW